MMMEATLRSTGIYDDREPASITLTARRETIEFNPDFESMGAFQIDLPEGTKVADMDFRDPPLGYLWKGGRLVPDNKEDLIRVIDETMAALRTDASSEPIIENLRGTGTDETPVNEPARAQEEPASTRRRLGLPVLAVVIALSAVAGALLVYRKRTHGEKA